MASHHLVPSIMIQRIKKWDQSIDFSEPWTSISIFWLLLNDVLGLVNKLERLSPIVLGIRFPTTNREKVKARVGGYWTPIDRLRVKSILNTNPNVDGSAVLDVVFVFDVVRIPETKICTRSVRQMKKSFVPVRKVVGFIQPVIRHGVKIEPVKKGMTMWLDMEWFPEFELFGRETKC